MSAFVVDTTHIDALLTAGLWSRGGAGPLAWFEREFSPTERAGIHEPGLPWGPDAQEICAGVRRELTVATAGRIGAMLLAENMRSVNHRYDENEWEQPYEFHRLPGGPAPVTALHALRCYEYQSCEHVEWSTSEARQFCDALRLHLIKLLPGYDDAPWEITDPATFTHARD
jgi:hypothetical protein